MARLLENIILENNEDITIIPKGTIINEAPTKTIPMKQLVTAANRYMDKLKQKLKGKARMDAMTWMRRMIDSLKKGDRDQIVRDKEYLERKSEEPNIRDIMPEIDAVLRAYQNVSKYLGMYRIEQGGITREGYEKILSTITEALDSIKSIING
jgi:hypothetical protein